MSSVYIGKQLILEKQFAITTANAQHELLQSFFKDNGAVLEIVGDQVKLVVPQTISFIRQLNNYLIENDVNILNPNVLDVADPDLIAKAEAVYALKKALAAKQNAPSKSARHKHSNKDDSIATEDDPFIFVINLLNKLYKQNIQPFLEWFFGGIDKYASYEELSVTDAPSVEPAKPYVETKAPQMLMSDKTNDFTFRYTEEPEPEVSANTTKFTVKYR